jgi:hypothetical protein
VSLPRAFAQTTATIAQGRRSRLQDGVRVIAGWDQAHLLAWLSFEPDFARPGTEAASKARVAVT